jgi:predicted dehydrogenase
MQKTNRRKFIGASLATGTGLTLTTTFNSAWAGVKGSNTDVRVGVIGCGGKGSAHARHLKSLKSKGVRVTGVCDPDTTALARQKKTFADSKTKINTYTDIRKFLEDKEVDAVIIATPNHWHTLAAIWALQAGKHVYVEKPVSHNIWEGGQLVKAAEKYSNLIVQHGMQRRSATGWNEIMEWIKDEPLGKMLYSHGFCYKPRKSIGKVQGPQKPPETLNYELWSGPRGKLPIMRSRFHYDWHWQWPYGNGDIGNQGPHQLDVARWVLGQDSLPTSVISVGCRLGYDDDGTSANTQIAYFDYKPCPLIFEVRGLPRKGLDWNNGMDNYRGIRIGNVIHFEGGHIAENRAFDKDGKTIKKFGDVSGRGHLENYIKSIQTGNQLYTSKVHHGHWSAGLAHMANTSYRIGSTSTPEVVQEVIGDNKSFRESFDRLGQHLDSNGIDFAKDKVSLGANLIMDPETEEFTGKAQAAKANKIEKGIYKAPYTVPKKV